MPTMWRKPVVRGGLMAAVTMVMVLPTPATAQVTYTKDIAPILQRSCEKCHRDGQIAPMALTTYAEVRPYARAIKNRTALRDRQGVMPPWHIEKNIGIQGFKNDPSLSDAEIQLIADWADNGAPRGNQADLPPPLQWVAADQWGIGEPDLIVKSTPFTMAAQAPDWWGSFDSVDMGLTEDRYVAAYELREVNDARSQASKVKTGAATTAGLGVVHHGTVTALGPRRASGPWRVLPRSRSGAQRGLFRPGGGEADHGGVEPDVCLDPHARERARHDGTPGDRVQVPPARV